MESCTNIPFHETIINSIIILDSDVKALYHHNYISINIDLNNTDVPQMFWEVDRGCVHVHVCVGEMSWVCRASIDKVSNCKTKI